MSIIENLTIEDMNTEISNFIDTYWGTAIGESIYHKRANTSDDDYDGLKDIYEEIQNEAY